MPSVRSQRVYDTGDSMALEIVSSSGLTFTLTKAQIQAFYQSTSGNAASRRAQVITWIKDGIVAAFTLPNGIQEVSLAELDYDFDTLDGRITTARIGRAP